MDKSEISRLISTAEKLQKEAVRILKEIGLMEILAKFSSPKIVGSVASGLLVTKDIDIHAYIQNYDIKKVVNLLPKLATLPTIQKIQFNNYRELRRDYLKNRIDFPHAYYVGLRTIQPSGEWKIDIWFAKKEDIEEFDDPRLGSLTDEQKGTILSLKQKWSAQSGYKDGVTGLDFYRAVLDFNVKNEDDFKLYLQKV